MQSTSRAPSIVVLDFGSQYSQLIARRVRECQVYCEILPYSTPPETLERIRPKGIILSGGPFSVYSEDAPLTDREVFQLGIPVLGICYGLQLMGFLLGGEVEAADKREYGKAELFHEDTDGLFHGLGQGLTVWMSHADRLKRMPEAFVSIAHTANSPVAALKSATSDIYGLQFHPEVVHTPQGMEIIKNFLFRICGCSPAWTMGSFVEETVEQLRSLIGHERVLCALSGGVDSSVTALLLHRAIGDQLACVFVDNGFLRKDEAKLVKRVFDKHLAIPVHYVDAADWFIEKLEGVIDPEEKRKIIGREFLRVFEEEAGRLGSFEFLAQGTLYPDVIESAGASGPAAVIKSHHNVGGLPERMHFKLVEPLRELFKDEVRQAGAELGLTEDILLRHPFPGPGLAIRIVGDVTRERLDTLREADAIAIEEIRKAGLYDRIWQALTVLLPVRTVGVMGDERTYGNVVALRAVTSMDGMTADWFAFPPEVLRTISNRIINEVRGVNRVVYDISSKPPSTIEWE